MRAKGTWVLLFFLASTLLVALALSYAMRDIFSWLQLNNMAIIGDQLRLSGLIAIATAIFLGLFFGVFYKKSRNYVEQCLVEYNKVAFPRWPETKGATFTVVIVSFVASIILGVFDMIFSWLTSHNLFIL